MRGRGGGRRLAVRYHAGRRGQVRRIQPRAGDGDRGGKADGEGRVVFAAVLHRAVGDAGFTRGEADVAAAAQRAEEGGVLQRLSAGERLNGHDAQPDFMDFPTLPVASWAWAHADLRVGRLCAMRAHFRRDIDGIVREALS